jgi:hypothetical protein
MDQQMLTPTEIKTIIVALQGVIEDMGPVINNPKYNFTPDFRKGMKDVFTNATSAKAKLEAIVNRGDAFRFEPYQPGDENEFLTKQS